MRVQALNSRTKLREYFYITRPSITTVILKTPDGEEYFLIAQEVADAIELTEEDKLKETKHDVPSE